MYRLRGILSQQSNQIQKLIANNVTSRCMVATENNKLHLINKANEKRTLLDRKKLKLLYNITSTCSYTNKTYTG